MNPKNVLNLSFELKFIFILIPKLSNVSIKLDKVFICFY